MLSIVCLSDDANGICWMYEGCVKCGSKPHVQDSIVMCSGCKKKMGCIEPKWGTDLCGVYFLLCVELYSQV